MISIKFRKFLVKQQQKAVSLDRLTFSGYYSQELEKTDHVNADEEKEEKEEKKKGEDEGEEGEELEGEEYDEEELEEVQEESFFFLYQCLK